MGILKATTICGYIFLAKLVSNPFYDIKCSATISYYIHQSKSMPLGRLLICYCQRYISQLVNSSISVASSDIIIIVVEFSA